MGGQFKGLQANLSEHALESGAVCLAGIVQQPQAICVLLHDRHADLDRMRQFANPLERYSICPMLLDLPGHGLSSEDEDTDSMAAIESAFVYAERERCYRWRSWRRDDLWTRFCAPNL